MVETVEDHQHELLERYDAVLVTDVDEIVTRRPSGAASTSTSTGSTRSTSTASATRSSIGSDREDPYDPSRKVLDQRGYWYAHDAYDKPALASVPMKWKPGFHQRARKAQLGPRPSADPPAPPRLRDLPGAASQVGRRVEGLETRPTSRGTGAHTTASPSEDSDRELVLRGQRLRGRGHPRGDRADPPELEGAVLSAGGAGAKGRVPGARAKDCGGARRGERAVFPEGSGPASTGSEMR